MFELFSPWTIGLTAAIFSLTLFFHLYRYSSRTLEIAPNVLTSLGIFGTFLGVALGLSQFNTADIQSSVPTLMDGLKTAFWSSIAGLLGALSIKLRSAWFQLQSLPDGSAQGVTAEDLKQGLNDIKEQLIQQLEWEKSQQVSAELKSIESHLRLNAEQQHRVLLGELQKINLALANYQERMAEANAKALVNAIEMVMKEFNTKINEQYGDNFKRLNESVISMLEWQQANKIQITELISEQERSSASMSKACDAFEYMVKHADAFNGVSASLEQLLNALESQRDSLQKQLSSLGELITGAASGLPHLEERVVALTSGMAEAVTKQQAWLVQDLSESQKTLQTDWQAQLQETHERVQAQQQQSLLQYQRLGEKLERQVGILEESLEAELTQSLNTLGIQLASLSEKFVSDYSPLTDKLQRLVRVAEAVNES